MANLPNVSDVWQRDPPWAAIYSSGVGNEPLARVVGRVFWGTDIGLLYRAASVIGEQPDGAAVLDVPCGGGVALRGLRRGQNVRYVAADISDAMLGRTGREAERRGLEQVELRHADAEELPFADGEFDLVYTVLAVEQMERIRDAALAEIARVSRGHVLMLEPFKDANRRGVRRLYAVSRNYFRGSIQDLARFGLEPLWATDDFPQEAFLGSPLVLARKMPVKKL
jgi:SAM-dependent methyltransferase